jgi:hypothetical protein
MGEGTHAVERQDWYGRLVNPIRRALYANDQAAAAAALATARGELADPGHAPAERELMGYVLQWYEFVISSQSQPPEQSAAQYEQALELFSRTAETAPGEVQRRRMLAILRCTGRLYGCADLDRPELEELIGDLPDLAQDEFLWHNIAGWAFASRDAEMLRRAYEVMLTEPSNLLGQAKWQRVNLMLMLVEGRATRRDVEFVIDRMAVLPQVIEFRRWIWPECIRQGLSDDELELRLEEQYQRITADPPVPELEPRTKHILG